MFKMSRKSMVSLIAGAVFLMATLAIPASAQELEKKYAPILGDYEFEMGEGMGVMTVQFYVENDALYAWPKDMGDPGLMTPVEGEEFVFTIEGDDGSSWRIEFIKDENGKYNTCHAVNEMMAVDITGKKIIE